VSGELTHGKAATQVSTQQDPCHANMNSNSDLYRPLIDRDAIRVLAIKPASSHSAELQGFLLETTLSERDRDIIGSFTALSYVWGDTSRVCAIQIDGKTTHITATLDLALRDLRDATRVLRIWADAICIDQSNIQERNQQVSLMGSLFATAQHTIIHLGPPTPEAESVLRELSLKTSVNRLNLDGHRNLASKAAHTLVHDHILTRPWFRRIWVLQELVLSKDPWIQCGTARIRWKDFCLSLRKAIEQNARILPPVTNGVKNNWAVLRGINQTRLQASHANFPCSSNNEDTNRNLLGLLHLRRGLGATDPRDFVFAHLGLALDCFKTQPLDQDPDIEKDEYIIPIDYQKSCAYIFAQVVFYIFGRNFWSDESALYQVLSLCEDFDPENGMPNLPSWVPDVSTAQSYVIFICASLQHAQWRYALS
jgi:hypothetical protein